MRSILGALALACAAAPALAQTNYYWRFPNTDADLMDIKHETGRTIPQMMSDCDADPACQGFNTDGWLKNCTSPQCVQGGQPCDLYVKMSVPQAYYPNVWPLPTSITNGSATVLLDATKFQVLPIRTNTDLNNGIQRLLGNLFPNPATSFSKRTRPLPLAAGTIPSLTISVGNLTTPLQFGVDESYTLTIPANGSSATLVANTIYGAYLGMETFSQLVVFDYPSKTYQVTVAPVVIHDAPKFGWRGLLIDTSRHFEPLPSLMTLITSMTYAKLNALHWHIVDLQSFPFESVTYPNLWNGAYSPQERYTQEDVAAIVEYGRQRGVRVFPEFDTPGHAASWCVGYPDICPSPTCTMPLNVANNATFDLIDGLLAEMTGRGVPGVGLFPDQYFHLGGDEVNTDCWTSTPAIQQWLTAHGYTADQGYEYFVLRVHAIAIAQGRQPINWEEVWQHFGTQLDKSSIIHAWLSTDTLPNCTSHGYRGIWSVDGRWYLDGLGVTWDSMYEQDPLQGITDPNQQKLVLGGEGCMWGETVDTSDLEQTVWPRAAAIAERLWSYDAIGFNSAIAAWQRFEWFRCLLNRRGIAAAPANNPVARTSPPQPGSCYVQ